LQFFYKIIIIIKITQSSAGPELWVTHAFSLVVTNFFSQAKPFLQNGGKIGVSVDHAALTSGSLSDDSA
jgi:hypothetical protein